MKEMIYQNTLVREWLAIGEYKGFKYRILNLGTHPTAYVNIPEGHKFFGKDNNEIILNCNGGCTYSRPYIIEENKTRNTSLGWWIGWDYAHADDFQILPSGKEWPGKKWTTEDILQEVKSVIDKNLKS